MLKTYLNILSKPFTLYLLIWGLYFTWVWSHQLNLTPTGIVAGSIASWADGAAHLTYISSFANRSLLPHFLPVYLYHPFTYPFAADFLAGMLVRSGLSLITSYTFIGLTLSLAFLYLLYQFYYRFLHHHWAAFISCHLFLFSGGLGFYWFLLRFFTEPFDLNTFLLPEYTHLEKLNIYFINIITSELLPQRAFLLGISIGLFLLIFLWRTIAQPASSSMLLFVVFGALYGLLPIIHPHTFITLASLIAWTTLLTFKHSHLRRGWLVFGLVTISISLPLIFTFILPGTVSGFIKFYPGWLARTYLLNWFEFWWLNWGFFPLIALLGFFTLSRTQKLFLAPFFLVFVLANLFLFQPYDWDNTKILTWVYLVLSAPAATLIYRLFTRGLWFKVISGLVFITLTFSGFLDVSRVLNYSQQAITMFTSEELQLTDWVKTNTSTDSIFLTSTVHNHFVPALAGRQIVMGYQGWLWSYGIDYSDRQGDISAIYSGSDSALELINLYQINYIVIGPTEINQYHPNQVFFRTHYPIAVSTPSYTIFKVKPF